MAAGTPVLALADTPSGCPLMVWRGCRLIRLEAGPPHHHGGNKTPGATSARPELIWSPFHGPLSRPRLTQTGRAEGTGWGWMGCPKSGRPWGTGMKEDLESDLTSNLDAASPQSLPFFEFSCLQSDFTTSESCWKEEKDNSLVTGFNTHKPQ